MEKPDVKIKYFYNSGFTVETRGHLLVFDYWKDGENAIKDVIKTEKKIIVFVSHNHRDHYNPEIFNWAQTNPGIEYVVGNDVKPKVTFEKLHRMARYKELVLDDAKIKTFGSTDVGVSFLVETDGTAIFHAGDLNWWHWDDETEEYNKNMAARFKKEISKIKGEKIDIAFFPVDPRLGKNRRLGPDYFISEIKPLYFIPMHYGSDTGIREEYPDFKLFL